MPSKKESAIALAQAGHRVFPLAPNSKTPAHAGVNWRKIASSDPVRVAEMWTDPVFNTEIDYNTGIAPTFDLLVFDEDVSEGKQGDKSRQLLEAIYDPLPETFTVRSARGGLHRYYRTHMPVANSASRVGKHIDIKSEGGFVVGPGSTTPDGEYVVVNDAQIADAPQWLIDMAGKPKERATVDSAAPLVDLDSEAAIARATDWLATAAPESGTYSVAARIKDFGISLDRCTDLMMDHWPPAEAKGEDHIRFRVENAYRYGQNAPGIASAEAEFEPVEIDAKPSPKRKGLYVVRWGDAKPVLDQPYLIDKVIDLGTMVVTYGDSNVGKTYVKLDQCFHIAAGIDWNGHKVKQGLVVYVAAEGGTGFMKRIEAFKRHYGVKELPFSLVPCPVDLQSDKADTSRLIKLIRDEEAHFGQKCVLVVIDTLARAMGGGDENTSVDMGRFVGHSDALRAATGATVDIIHHTGKDKAKGARGHSSLRAATDTELEIREGEFEATKQRDMARGQVLKFELVNVEVGKRPDGETVAACVVRWLAVNEFDVTLSPAAQEMFDIMEQMDAAERDAIDAGEGKAENDKCDIWMPWSALQLSFLSQIKGAKGKGVGRSALFKLRQELSQAGKIKRDQQNQWAIVKSH